MGENEEIDEEKYSGSGFYEDAYSEVEIINEPEETSQEVEREISNPVEKKRTVLLDTPLDLFRQIYLAASTFGQEIPDGLNYARINLGADTDPAQMREYYRYHLDTDSWVELQLGEEIEGPSEMMQRLRAGVKDAKDASADLENMPISLVLYHSSKHRENSSEENKENEKDPCNYIGFAFSIPLTSEEVLEDRLKNSFTLDFNARYYDLKERTYDPLVDARPWRLAGRVLSGITEKFGRRIAPEDLPTATIADSTDLLGYAALQSGTKEHDMIYTANLRLEMNPEETRLTLEDRFPEEGVECMQNLAGKFREKAKKLGMEYKKDNRKVHFIKRYE